MKDFMSTIVGTVIATALVVGLALGAMAFSAVVIGGVAAMFLESPFRYGWDRAWTRWGWSFAFWFFIIGGSGMRTQGRR